MALTETQKKYWWEVWGGKGKARCQMPVYREQGGFRRCSNRAEVMIDLGENLGLPLCFEHFRRSEDPDQIVAYPEIGEAIRSGEQVPLHPRLELDWRFRDIIHERVKIK